MYRISIRFFVKRCPFSGARLNKRWHGTVLEYGGADAKGREQKWNVCHYNKTEKISMDCLFLFTGNLDDYI